MSIARRSFSQWSSRLLKSEQDDIKATFKFLTKGSSPSSTLYSLLHGGAKGNSSGAGGADEDKKHVTQVLKLLNKGLPEVDYQKKKVDAHYDVLFSQLKSIVSESVKSANVGGKNNPSVKSSNELYNHLMNLYYTGRLKSTYQVAQIILAPHFTDYDRLWSNLCLFDNSPQLQMEIAVLLYYKSRNNKIYKEYGYKWMALYHSMHPSTRRFFWKCVAHRAGGSLDSFTTNIARLIQQQIGSWTGHDMIILYQALYDRSHLLPELPIVLTQNQQLFIRTLRVVSLSQQTCRAPTIRTWLLRLLKMSVENRLASETVPSSTQQQHHVSVYQYRFIRSLDVAVREIYNLCQEDPERYTARLSGELKAILDCIVDEEQEVKSQMDLMFV